MKLIIGLGNPGAKYINTRHNIGFWVVDAWGAFENINFENTPKFKAEIAKINNSLRLVKPQTFMNLSGEAVINLVQFFQVPLSEIVVFHDEIDLPIGIVRVKQGGGNAGHNGLKSLSQHLGSPDFWRIRIGVGRPSAERPDFEVADYVLGKPQESETNKYIIAIDEILDVRALIAEGKMEEVKQHFHKLEKLAMLKNKN